MAKTVNGINTNYHISSSSESLGVCEKLFTAIKASLRPRTPTPPRVQNRHFTPKTSQIRDVNKVVPIEWTVDKEPEIGIDRDGNDQLNKACSEFINRAGAKIRKSDGHGGDGAIMVMKKKESFKDQASDYISRPKVIKISRSPYSNSAKEMSREGN